MPSPFLTPGPTAEADTLAVLHLRRNHVMPTILRLRDDEDMGYKEGKVTNTRYGSFPHSTLIGKPWGSQILASKVDTGSRGRREKGNSGTKRKAEEMETSEVTDETRPSQPTAVATTSGFIHLLLPTPESWTYSLPHRTQVVYTPDYSYILHRIRARPGSTLIEAGAGSGSFTHAAARAVFSGYPSEALATKRRRLGKVCSFEFHEQRVEKIKVELRNHGLEGIVEVNHRDVYNEGFLLGKPVNGESPKANAVFLDLPAPWQALKHLVREPADGSESPLDPSSPVHICTFSPCIEQVQQTVSALRQHGWLGISMVEVAQRQIEVHRERYAADDPTRKGAISAPRNVDEALNSLLVHEERTQTFHARKQNRVDSDAATARDEMEEDIKAKDESEDVNSGVAATPSAFKAESTVPGFKKGNLIHRTEPDLKTHTSYLVFATLPMGWSEADEQRCRQQWPASAEPEVPEQLKKSKKQMRREAAEERKRENKSGHEQGQTTVD